MSPKEIRPLVYPDMSGKYGTGLNLSMGAIPVHEDRVRTQLVVDLLTDSSFHDQWVDCQ